MKSNSKKFSVSSALKKIRNGSMDLDPEYQRGAVWGRARKALLVDSMLRGYDLPKIYLRETSNSHESYEVVDGVQRLTTMDDFAQGEFPLPKSSEFSGFRYHQLPELVQERFDDYQLDFTVLEDCTDEEVREMFLRLQQGVRLNTAEELRAVIGGMNDYVEVLVALRFFERAACFTKSRGASRHVAAQISKLALGGIGDVRKADLMKFYSDHREWTPNASANQLKTVLNWLHSVFGDTHPVLHRPFELAVYPAESYRALVTRLGMRSSMGRTGVCWDNALAESFFSALKNERVYRTVYATKAQAKRDVRAYIEGFYNSRRRHSALGYRRPNAVHHSYRQLDLAA